MHCGGLAALLPWAVSTPPTSADVSTLTPQRRPRLTASAAVPALPQPCLLEEFGKKLPPGNTR